MTKSTQDMHFAEIPVGETFAFILDHADVGWPCHKVSAPEYEFSDPPDDDTTIYTANGSEFVRQDA